MASEYENLKIGETRRYHEEGNVGNVQILEIDHHYKIGYSDYTQIKVRALEELSGSRLVNPFPLGDEWECTVLNEGGGQCGWYIE